MKDMTKKTVMGLRKTYCEFMVIDSIPFFDVRTFKNNSSVQAFVNYSKDNTPILNLKYDFIPMLKDNATPVVYHEFTHILDNDILLPKLDLKSKTPFIKMYSEYHAIQVQMKSAVHFAKYNDNQKITLDDKTYDWFKNKTVQEDIIFKTKDCIATIQDILNKKQDGYVFNLLLHCTYYLSMYDFWKNNCKNDIFGLTRMDIPETLSGSEFNMYSHILSKIEDRNNEYFKLLYFSQQQMAKYFGLNENNITEKILEN